MRFAADFGRDQVFTLGSRQEREHSKHKVAGESIGRVLFAREHNLEQLIARILRGETVVLTELSEEYTFDDYQAQNPDSLIVFAVSPDQDVVFPVADTPVKPLPKWQVAALRPPSNPDRT